jgi:hypothetical protein
MKEETKAVKDLSQELAVIVFCRKRKKKVKDEHTMSLLWYRYVPPNKLFHLERR